MNDLFASLIIAIVQGLTEWLPVSSSGHIILFEKLLGYEGGLLFNVALHFGTLMAVFVYFGKDITDIIQDFFKGDFKSENSKLGIYLIIATIPVGIIGFIFRDLFESSFESLLLTGLGFGVTGLLLFIASIDFKGRSDLKLRNSIIIGLSQIMALFPGISRSGTTMSTGLLSGLDEKKALKFSFLLSIPVIFGANILEVGNKALPQNMIWASLFSFVIGLIALHLLYSKILVNKKNLRWFAGYALLLGTGVVIYSLI